MHGEILFLGLYHDGVAIKVRQLRGDLWSGTLNIYITWKNPKKVGFLTYLKLISRCAKTLAGKFDYEQP